MERKPVAIVLRRRSSDWMAYLKGDIATCEAGNDAEEAVRKLCVTLGLRQIDLTWPVEFTTTAYGR